MPQIAKGYSDTEILAIASWFADQNKKTRMRRRAAYWEDWERSAA